ncbi:MAG: response regulator transcription factor [Oscillospiraceae bacterium]
MIFCVEDDANIRELTEYALKSCGFEPLGFSCATDFFEELKINKPELVLLDIMLPDMDGIEILKIIRSSPITADIPIIMLTAKSGEIDKVKGLDLGADDYVTKPFSVLELISRIKAVLRRSEQKVEPAKTCESIEIDSLKRQVLVDGVKVTLTYKEFELLDYLIKNKGIVLTRDQLMNRIWGFDFTGDCRTIDVHVGTLRQKLGKRGKIIETVRNVGYKISG